MARAKALVANPVFGIVMMTFASLSSAHHGLFGTLNNVVIGIYVVELLIRITACGWNLRVFVRDGWNIFDFLVVVTSPAMGTLLLIYIYGNTGVAMLTMFLMLTLENLPDNTAMGMEISPWTMVFFVSYAVLASFLIFNPSIGIVLNSMEDARSIATTGDRPGIELT
ncbi:ion transporter [Mycobacterium sp. C31M]